SAMLRRSARRHGTRSAILCGGVRWSYEELDLIVDRLATGLSASGIAEGDRVAILSRNSHAFIAVRFAVARIAAILVPINFMLKQEEVAYILEHSGARIVFADASTIDVALGAAPANVKLYGLAGEDTVVPERGGVSSWESLFASEKFDGDAADSGDLLQIV